MKIIGKYKAGRLANGWENDKGHIIHGLEEGQWTALCGTQPGEKSVGWLPFDENLSFKEVTCKKCILKIRRII